MERLSGGSQVSSSQGCVRARLWPLVHPSFCLVKPPPPSRNMDGCSRCGPCLLMHVFDGRWGCNAVNSVRYLRLGSFDPSWDVPFQRIPVSPAPCRHTSMYLDGKHHGSGPGES
ncbi:hypothetical protein N658DRAFT_125436 [Parathielavia hyrcaniae]|uniref:Uncharacterized protein n=1 Tax=Parathielavia hyrcaniae TaxID=113614 RepID=A0AAN6Q8L8_9PEZI|nr:hypothetical protein N658DRAFT_125436 [Parathielavia hyrcaniae]